MTMSTIKGGVLFLMYLILNCIRHYCLMTLRDAPLDFKGGAGSFCKKKNLTHSKVKKKKKLDPHITGKKKKLDPHGKKKKKTYPARVKKKTYPHIEEGEKSTHLGPQLFRGEGKATLKRRVSFWSVTMTFPSKVVLYGACRVFVL